MFYPIELDKTRNFRYGMKAISIIEKKFKKPVGQINMERLTMEEMAILLWAGLVHEDDKLTSDKVMDLVDDYSNLPTTFKAMQEAFKSAFGVTEEEEEEGSQVEEKKTIRR